MHADWKLEDYLPANNTAAPVGEAISTAAPEGVIAAADGECSANMTAHTEIDPYDGEVEVIEIREDELPRVQWHHPGLYDTLVQVNYFTDPRSIPILVTAQAAPLSFIPDTALEQVPFHSITDHQKIRDCPPENCSL